MDVSTYSELVAQRLHPRPYTNRVTEVSDDIHLLLTCKKLMLARYALAVSSWEPSLDGSAFLKSKRRAVARTLGAIWTFREVGLYMVICGAESEWHTHAATMLADNTGLHAVIVQAVHFVDLQTGATQLNQSAWGPVRFGGVDSVAEVINSIPLNHDEVRAEYNI
ncbi:hypothetical protein [uncultured Rubinisphaera sp.]|mgnify:FL=1|uniref:hypothetical protein n=1 Tax=uncultured Rubinisphaera sp. TaxID=1678686 RepID=UPI0030D79C05